MKPFSLVIAIMLTFTAALPAGEWDGPTVKNDSQMRYCLHTGFTFDAVLKTAIMSFNTITPVIAETEYDITFLGTCVIPKHTKIIGFALIEKTIDRVNVNFHTLVFPNGREVKFSGLALSKDGSGGVAGIVHKYKKARLPAKVLLSAAATGASYASQSSLPAEMIKGIADETNQQLAEKIDYSIEVKSGTGIQVYVIDRLEY